MIAQPRHMTEEPMKASVLIGCVLVGMGMLLQAVPPLVTVLAAQVVWGIGSKTAVSTWNVRRASPCPEGRPSRLTDEVWWTAAHPAAGFRRDRPRGQRSSASRRAWVWAGSSVSIRCDTIQLSPNGSRSRACR